MANNKMGKWGFAALSVILICFVLILFCLPLISCEPIPQNGSETREKHQIECIRNTIIKESGAAVTYIYVFEFEGHRYAMSGDHHYFVHLASCPCQQKEELSLTFPSTSSSNSLFDW